VPPVKNAGYNPAGITSRRDSASRELVKQCTMSTMHQRMSISFYEYGA